MRILIYTPSPLVFKRYLPLTKMFRQHGWQVEVSTEEQECFSSLATDLYSTLLFLASEDSIGEIQKLHGRFKALDLHSLFGVITSLDSYTERARSLGNGVDYYYIVPFSYTQLLSDISLKVHSRQEPLNQSLQVGRFRLDVLARRAFLDGSLLTLTRIQFELLALFLRRRGAVLSRVQIWEEIWGFGDYPLANTIDVHVNRLRRRLANNGRLLIKTVHGIGYQMEDVS